MKEVVIKTRKQWRNWLVRNHKKENKVALISYKKHTGIPFITHREAMEEAICFGWIDTTIRRLDDSRFIRTFMKRGPNAKWSKNTLSYGKELMKKGLMAPAGIEAYKKGLKKKPHDHDNNYEPPLELLKILNKKVNQSLKQKYDKVAPSTKKPLHRWINSAKRQETLDKRIKITLDKLRKGERLF